MADRRIAVIGIIVENIRMAEKVNSVLHEFSEYIIGRMGIPYKKEGIGIISVVLDAPPDVISTVSGRLGMIPDVSVKSLQSKVLQDQ